MNILKPPPRPPTIESRAFLLLLVVVTLAFGLILRPFYGAVFWGMVLAILFNPLYRRILRSTRQRPTLAALATMSLVIVIVVLPLTFIVTALVQETAAVFQRIQSGELNFATMLQQIFDACPKVWSGYWTAFSWAAWPRCCGRCRPWSPRAARPLRHRY